MPETRGRHHRPAEPPLVLVGPEWRAAIAQNLGVLTGVLADLDGRPIPLGMPVLPDDSAEWRRVVALCLASLNELAAEIAAETSGDPAFVAMVDVLMRDHTWALGYEFRSLRPPAGWAPAWERI